MKVVETELPGVLLLEPRIFRDERGYFFENWSAARYAEHGIPERFVQDNVSFSRRGVLRGLHFQEPYAQGKLVAAPFGRVWDVAVDIRPGSASFGKWFGCELSGANGRQMYIPAGFAHGFVVLSDEALFSYKCTEYYHPEAECTLQWDDEELAIAWPVEAPILGEKDRHGLSLSSLAGQRARTGAVRST